MTQNNLALALSDRIGGDRAQNLEDAIACYRAALEVRTQEDLPISVGWYSKIIRPCPSVTGSEEIEHRIWRMRSPAIALLLRFIPGGFTNRLGDDSK